MQEALAQAFQPGRFTLSKQLLIGQEMPLGQKFPLCPDSSLLLAAEVTDGDQQTGCWSTRPVTRLGIASEATEIVSS